MRKHDSSDSSTAAIEQLFLDHYQTVLRYALRRTGARNDAEDIVAETFLAAWRQIDKVSSMNYQKAWLLRTASQVLDNHRRTQRRAGSLKERLEGLPISLDQVLIETKVETSSEVAAALAVLATLRANDQEILTLHCVADLTHAEIADVLGCRPDLVRSKLSRAKKRFRAAGRTGSPDKVRTQPDTRNAALHVIHHEDGQCGEDEE